MNCGRNLMQAKAYLQTEGGRSEQRALMFLTSAKSDLNSLYLSILFPLRYKEKVNTVSGFHNVGCPPLNSITNFYYVFLIIFFTTYP